MFLLFEKFSILEIEELMSYVRKHQLLHVANRPDIHITMLNIAPNKIIATAFVSVTLKLKQRLP